MCTIGTEESNNKNTRINADSITCDKKQKFKFKSFAEECIKMCYSKNRHTEVKSRLKRKKGQDVYNTKGINYR